MRKDLKNIKDIDDYLSGDLDQEHLVEFEKRLHEDDELRKYITTAKKVIDGIEGYAFKEMLRKLHTKLFNENPES